MSSKKKANDNSESPKPRSRKTTLTRKGVATATSTPPAKPSVAPELSKREREICEAVYARQAEHPCAPFKMTGEGKDKKLGFDHSNTGLAFFLMMNALGTASPSFFEGLVCQLATVGASGAPNERELNFAASMVRGLGPRDEGEAMLAAQMAAVHVATMKAAQRLARAETVEQQDSASTALNKLARTTTVWLTLEQIQLVAILPLFGAGLLLRKSL